LAIQQYEAHRGVSVVDVHIQIDAREIGAAREKIVTRDETLGLGQRD
jgi:hypothetical protein